MVDIGKTTCYPDDGTITKVYAPKQDMSDCFATGMSICDDKYKDNCVADERELARQYPGSMFDRAYLLNCNDCANKDKECYHCIYNDPEVSNYFTPIIYTYFCDVCGMRWDSEKKDIKICPNCGSTNVIIEKDEAND